MLKSVDPFPTILTSIWVCVSSFSMFFVQTVVTFVPTTILPGVKAHAVHYPIFELTFKVTTIRPLECTFSWHFIGYPVSLISWTICPEINTQTLFNSIWEISEIIASVWPYFYTFSTLLFCTIWLTEHTKSGGFVLQPHSFVNIVFRSFENSDANRLSIQPEAFKYWAIWPLKFTVSALNQINAFRTPLYALLRSIRFSQWACLT